MSDVSCRVYAYFQAAEQAGWLNVDALLEDLPLSRKFLEKPSNRVPWHVWRQLCERSGQQLGTADRIRDSGAFAINPTVAGYLGPAATIFSSPRDIYRIAFRWLCPSVHRAHRFTYAELPDGRLELGIEVKDGYEGCLTFMLMYEGALRAVPRFVRHPDAVVSATVLTDRRARFLVTPPAPLGIKSRFQRLLRASRTAADIEAELTFQQQQLLSTYELLRTSERSFRSVLDALPVLVAIHREGRILYANPSLAERLGWPASELVGRSFESIVLADDRLRLMAFVLDRSNEGQELEHVRMRTASGGELHIGALGLPNVSFEGEAARGFFALDLTAHRHIEEELERSEETMQALVSGLPDLIVRLDEQGVVVDAQAGGAMRAAQRLRDTRGRPVAELVGDIPGLSRDFLEQGLVVVREALASGEVRSLERMVDYADGPSRLFELRIVPIAARREVVVIARDVTARRERDRQMAIADRMVSLGTLAAGVAHEINNPLTYVMGSLDDIDRGLAQMRRGGGAASSDVAGLQAALDQAREGVARVTAIVRSLKTFTRVDARSVAPVDVHELIEQAIALTHQEVRHRARLLRHYHASSPALADAVQLVQVLVNLLANAAQAIPEGNREAHEIRVLTGEDDGHVWIEVQDSGVGISPEVQRHVFDPFFTTKPRGRGTGLGLAISHRIIGEFGGALTVRSVPGKGSTFRVELTRTGELPAPAVADMADAPRRQPSLGGHILIVEDEPAIADMVQRLLSDWRTSVVHSGHAALSALGGVSSYDLVLCDITMPEVSGVDVYESAIQLRPELRSRFIFMCGGVTTERAQKFLETDQPTVLWKPFDASELRSLVTRFFRDRRFPSSALPALPNEDADLR